MIGVDQEDVPINIPSVEQPTITNKGGSIKGLPASISHPLETGNDSVDDNPMPPNREDNSLAIGVTQSDQHTPLLSDTDSSSNSLLEGNGNQSNSNHTKESSNCCCNIV